MTKTRIIATLEAAYKHNAREFKVTGKALYEEKCAILRNQLILLYNSTLAAGEVEHLNDMMGA